MILGSGVPAISCDALKPDFTSPTTAVTSLLGDVLAPVTGGLSIAAAGTMNANVDAAAGAAKAEKDLAEQQAKTLAGEQAAFDAQTAREAVSGQNFGGDPSGRVFMTGIGFGTAPRISANEGSKNVSGMG